MFVGAKQATHEDRICHRYSIVIQTTCSMYLSHECFTGVWNLLSPENVLFWEAVQSFKSRFREADGCWYMQEGAITSAVEIYRNFIKADSISEVLNSS